MARPALEVADILRDHGPAWREANHGHVSLEQLKGTLDSVGASIDWLAEVS
jgi:hypothetical protein